MHLSVIFCLRTGFGRNFPQRHSVAWICHQENCQLRVLVWSTESHLVLVLVKKNFFFDQSSVFNKIIYWAGSCIIHTYYCQSQRKWTFVEAFCGFLSSLWLLFLLPRFVHFSIFSLTCLRPARTVVRYVNKATQFGLKTVIYCRKSRIFS